jgi:hypothetical protein
MVLKKFIRGQYPIIGETATIIGVMGHIVDSSMGNVYAIETGSGNQYMFTTQYDSLELVETTRSETKEAIRILCDSIQKLQDEIDKTNVRLDKLYEIDNLEISISNDLDMLKLMKEQLDA